MKQIRSAALQRHNAPPFGALDGLEVVALRKLPSWMRWLYLELRMLSDFKTGHVQTSWAVLAALMDCDKGGKGGPAPFVPSVQQLRRAVADLEALRLVERAGQVNERSRTLYLRVLPIKTLGAPAVKFDSSCDRPKRSRKPKRDKDLAQIAPGDSTAVATGDSVPVSITPSPLETPELSTAPQIVVPAQKPTRAAREILAAVERKRRRDAGQGEQQAPQGGQSIAQPSAAHAPPGRLGSGRSVLQPHQQTDEGPAALSTPRPSSAGHGAGTVTARQQEG